MVSKRLLNGMVLNRVVTEFVDDTKLVKEIEELEEQIYNKTKELKELRKNAVSKYRTELVNGELLLNLYCHSYYMYDAINNELIDFEPDFD